MRLDVDDFQRGFVFVRMSCEVAEVADPDTDEMNYGWNMTPALCFCELRSGMTDQINGGVSNDLQSRSR